MAKKENANYELLKLENQLCFPLYVAARKITSKYNPYFKPLDLTYAEYIIFMALWEKDGVTVGELCQRLFLNTSTITPVLKKMEGAGYIGRSRSKSDERSVLIELTALGRGMKKKCAHIPEEMGQCLPLSVEKLISLRALLYELIEGTN